MGTLLMRQASIYLQEKYRAARLAFTGVSQAELWTEQVTDNNPWNPDTKTMTCIAEASYCFGDYLRIVDVLHRRFMQIDWKRWRQYYNSLILLEFLITHGSEDFVGEFKIHGEVIKELGTFNYVDKEGVKWGTYMKNKSDRILELMQGGQTLQEVRAKAIKLKNEIQGFGNSSYSSSSSPSRGSWASSFDSNSSSSPTWSEVHDDDKYRELDQSPERELLKASPNKLFGHKMTQKLLEDQSAMSDTLDWDTIDDTFTDIDLNDATKSKGFFRRLCSKHEGYSPLKNASEKLLYRSFSDGSKEREKKLHYQHSFF